MGGVEGGTATGAGGSGQLVTTFITFGLVILIFYFLIIRPQNKRKKEAENMLKSLSKNDKVVTIGGIRGIVQAVKDDTVVIKVDDNVKLEFSKSAVSTILEKRASKQDSSVNPGKDENSQE
ncbi:MAG: preprotein translocase subunit YajC [Spirochaetes bacterium]|nr:MAG: preprotein translocase subunit YajC [Spirochaetota bacterium]